MGLPGVWTWGFGEGWGHFYADSVAVNHNAVGRGYETFGNATAETVERRLDPETDKFAGVAVTDPEWYRTSPPPKQLPLVAAEQRQLPADGRAGRAPVRRPPRPGHDAQRLAPRRERGARRGRARRPSPWPSRPRHDDPRRLERMIELLIAHGIEVARSSAGFTVKEGTFPAGTYLVRMDQPYRGYALDLLTAQKFPADKTPYEPYDDVAWALPFALGVEVTPHRGPLGAERRRHGAHRRAAVPGHGERGRSDVPAEGRRAGGAAGRPRAARGRRRAGGGEGLPLRRASTIPRARGSCARRASARDALADAARGARPRLRLRCDAGRGAASGGLAEAGRAADLVRHAVRRAGCAWPSTSGASPTR